MPHDLVDEPFDVALECSGNGRGQEAALAQLKRGGHARARRRGHGRGPKFDPNRILLNELVDHRRVRLRPRRLRPRARAARVGQAAERPARRAEDYPLDRLLDAAIGLHEGTLAAKAMIVPA